MGSKALVTNGLAHLGSRSRNCFLDEIASECGDFIFNGKTPCHEKGRGSIV